MNDSHASAIVAALNKLIQEVHRIGSKVDELAVATRAANRQ